MAEKKTPRKSAAKPAAKPAPVEVPEVAPAPTRLEQAEVKALIGEARSIVAGLHLPIDGQPRIAQAWEALGADTARIQAIAATLAEHYRPVPS